MAQPGFWDKQELAKALIDESNSIKGWLEPWRALDGVVSDLRALVELLEEEDDAELAAEFAVEADAADEQENGHANRDQWVSEHRRDGPFVDRAGGFQGAVEQSEERTYESTEKPRDALHDELYSAKS